MKGIMDMKFGTRVKDKASGIEYILGEKVGESRALYNRKLNKLKYVNYLTQHMYEVVGKKYE